MDDYVDIFGEDKEGMGFEFEVWLTVGDKVELWVGVVEGDRVEVGIIGSW